MWINSIGFKFVLSFILSSSHFLKIYDNFPFCLRLYHQQSELPLIEYATTNRLIWPLGLGRHVKSYNRIFPQTSGKDDTMIMTTTYVLYSSVDVNICGWAIFSQFLIRPEISNLLVYILSMMQLPFHPVLPLPLLFLCVMFLLNNMLLKIMKL